MIENDIERIEKKIDLFFKILLNLKIKPIGHLYNRKYIDNYIDELVCVYDLAAEKDIINDYPTQDEIQKWKNSLNTELDGLKQDYENGNLLVKEQTVAKILIKDLGYKLGQISKLSENKKKFEDKNTETYKINLFRDLQVKLGIIEEYDNYGYRKLVREKDNLKKKYTRFN